MRNSSKNILLATFLATSLLTNTVSNAASTDQGSQTQPLVMKAENIPYIPAPNFPKGAEITILRGDLSKPEPYTIRLKLPDGFVIPAHWHSTDEEVTVLSGTLNVGFGDTVDKDHSTALKAGGFQIVPALAHHYVWSKGATVIQLDGMGPRTTVFVNPAEWSAMIKKSLQ